MEVKSYFCVCSNTVFYVVFWMFIVVHTFGFRILINETAGKWRQVERCSYSGKDLVFLRRSIVLSLTSFSSVKGLYARCGQVKCIPLCTRRKVATLVFNGHTLKRRLLHLEVIRARNIRRWNTGGYITTQLNTGEYITTQLSTGGYITTQLSTGGYITTQLSTGGYITTQLNTGVYITTQLNTGGYITTQLNTGGYITTQLNTGGYITTQLNTGGYITTQLNTGGYITTQLNTGGYITTKLNRTLSKYSLFIHVGLVATAPLRFIMSAYPCTSLSVCSSVCLSAYVKCEDHSTNLFEILYCQLLCKSIPRNYKLG